MAPDTLKSVNWIRYYGYDFPCQLLCTVTLPLDWLRKTTLKWPLTLWNPSTRSEVMEMSFSMSADVYSDLIIGLAMKNYPKNDSSITKIHPLYLKIKWNQCISQLICTAEQLTWHYQMIDHRKPFQNNHLSLKTMHLEC